MIGNSYARQTIRVRDRGLPSLSDLPNSKTLSFQLLECYVAVDFVESG